MGLVCSWMPTVLPPCCALTVRLYKRVHTSAATSCLIVGGWCWQCACFASCRCRLDTSIALQVEKFHADAEERRKEKEAARIRREAAQAARCVLTAPFAHRGAELIMSI